jgi:YgiT-type zinc finger domain-containing protein
MAQKRADRCEYCGEPLKRARVRVYRRRGPRHVLFENVPALVCRLCGHRAFEAAAVDAMEHALDAPASKRPSVRLTVTSLKPLRRRRALGYGVSPAALRGMNRDGAK